MDSNLISLLTLGIKLCPCLPVDVCSLLLCLILWLGCAVEVSCRICSCRGGWVLILARYKNEKYLPSYAWVFLLVLFYQASPSEFYGRFSPLTFVQCSLPIWSKSDATLCGATSQWQSSEVRRRPDVTWHPTGADLTRVTEPSLFRSTKLPAVCLCCTQTVPCRPANNRNPNNTLFAKK